MELQIKQKAKEKRVSVATMAADIGVSKQTVYNWINGNVQIKDLAKIAAALDCHIFELFNPGSEFTHLYIEGKYKGLIKQ